MSDLATIFRYAYTSKQNGERFVARVTVHKRIESGIWVLLLLRPIGRWPDREDLSALADLAEERDVPLVSGILLTIESVDAWCETNLRPEGGEEWSAA